MTTPSEEREQETHDQRLQHAFVLARQLKDLLENWPARAPDRIAVVPEGWQIVPKEPTDEMLEASLRAEGAWVVEHIAERESGVEVECSISQEDADEMNREAVARSMAPYRAMLAASPKPPAIPAQEDASYYERYDAKDSDMTASPAPIEQAGVTLLDIKPHDHPMPPPEAWTHMEREWIYEYADSMVRADRESRTASATPTLPVIPADDLFHNGASYYSTKSLIAYGLAAYERGLRVERALWNLAATSDEIEASRTPAPIEQAERDHRLMAWQQTTMFALDLLDEPRKEQVRRYLAAALIAQPPTEADLAGVEIDEELFGKSLASLLEKMKGMKRPASATTGQAAVDALRTIASFPITSPANMDAFNMRTIALAVLDEAARDALPGPIPPADLFLDALEKARMKGWNEAIEKALPCIDDELDGLKIVIRALKRTPATSERPELWDGEMADRPATSGGDRG